MPHSVRNTLIEKMLIAKIQALVKIECEGGKRLSNTTGFGEAETTLPITWVTENVSVCDNGRDYTITEFAKEWRKCLYPDNTSITDEILMSRLSGWYATYKVVMAEFKEYCNCVDDYTWFQYLICDMEDYRH